MNITVRLYKFQQNVKAPTFHDSLWVSGRLYRQDKREETYWSVPDVSRRRRWIMIEGNASQKIGCLEKIRVQVYPKVHSLYFLLLPTLPSARRTADGFYHRGMRAACGVSQRNNCAHCFPCCGWPSWATVACNVFLLLPRCTPQSIQVGTAAKTSRFTQFVLVVIAHQHALYGMSWIISLWGGQHMWSYNNVRRASVNSPISAYTFNVH